MTDADWNVMKHVEESRPFFGFFRPVAFTVCIITFALKLEHVGFFWFVSARKTKRRFVESRVKQQQFFIDREG